MIVPTSFRSLFLALPLLSLAACDDGEHAREQTDYDIDEDVDLDDYAEGEEAPTVVEVGVAWNVSRFVDSKTNPELSDHCYMQMHTGYIPHKDQQFSILRAAIACGDMALHVGYVDMNGINRRKSSWTPLSSGHWQNNYEVPLALQGGNRFPTYVQACQTASPWKCYGMYR
ncbi:MAG: hypothetical protein AAGA54_18135 [Myxococcota bacterium]